MADDDVPPDRPAESRPDDLTAEPGPTSGDPEVQGPDQQETSVPLDRRARRRATKARRKNKKAPWWELPILVVVAIVVAILIKTFLIQPFYIPSASMENTLMGHPGHNDRILVSKVNYDFGDPSPGDIVVFKAPPTWQEEGNTVIPSNPVVKAVRGFGQLIGIVPPDTNPLIKRVIAVGGQTVKCCDAQGRVQVADSPDGPFRSLDEPYTHFTGTGQDQVFGPVTVPKGDMWVMGDHRDNSGDSRENCDGQRCTQGNATDAFVPTKNVIGKAVVIAWPPSRWRTLGTPKTFTSGADALGPALPGIAPVAAALLVVPLRRRRRRR